MLWLSIIAAVFLVLRLVVWKKSGVAAIDQFFWIQYRDARKASRSKVELPQYLLDLRQWYVPLFGRFLALLPNGLFRNGSALMLGISFVRLGLILLWAQHFVGTVTPWVALAGAVVFLSSPITAIHDNQLNGRIGGAILFDLLLALGLACPAGASVGLFASMSALVCILFFLHKLSLQLYIICTLAFLPLGNISWLMALLVGGVLAILLGYRKYAVAHWDISSFWFRNRNLLSAHQVNQSPLYGSEASAGAGLKSIAFQSATLLGMCPWAVLLVLANVPYWSAVGALILLASACISFVPAFKCWGHGRNYTYFLIAPVIYGLAATGGIEWTPLAILLVAGAFGVVTLSIWQYLGWLKGQAGAGDANLDNVLSAVADSDMDRLCCIPFAMADQLACRTGRSVFWGGHGYGFKWIEPYFPVFRHPIERAVSEWNLGAVLVRKAYWPDFKKQVDLALFNMVLENESYILLRVVDWKPGIRIPEWARNAYPALKGQLPEDEA